MAQRKRRGRRSFGAVRALPSGRYQASYLDPEGRRRNAPTTFTTLTDADIWLTLQRAALETGSWRGTDSRITVGEYAQTWFAALRVRSRTMYGYRKTFDRWIAPTFGTIAVTAVTPQMVRAWVGTFSEEHPYARVNAYRLLGRLFSDAISDGIVRETPVRVRGARQGPPPRQGHALTIDEILAVAENMPTGRGLAVILSAFCALRPGEVLALRRRDIDQTAHVVHVRETASARYGGGAHIGPTKTAASNRTVNYPAELHDQIAAHLAEHAAPGKAGHIFPSPRNPGDPLSSGAYLTGVKQAAKAAGLEDVRPHDLRHSGATLAAGTGATLRELMARLGHTSPEIAMQYQHSARERDRAIADALGASLRGSGSDESGPSSGVF
ncbi:tyrosine-type recombinase/integrase [Brachybacterium alimentarium]|uniref:tyrosine-type recombinase/integrase n=1 Tax=Brachybacterium alimentarium TaxID=47845 RepID=UPI00403DDEEF